MKRLIADIYKILYQLTGVKSFSLAFALIYITLLDLVIIKGVGLLLQDWVGLFVFVQKAFVFPYIIGAAILMFAINLLIMLPLKNLKRERQKKPAVIPILVYTTVAIIIYAYIHYTTRSV